MTVIRADDAAEQETGARVRRDGLILSVAALILVAICCLIGRWIAGPTLGVLWVAFASIAIVVPGMAYSAVRWRWMIYAIAATIAAGGVWTWTALPFAAHGPIAFSALTLLAFAIACGSGSAALSRLIPAVASSAIVTFVALAWLFWPIWLAHNLGGGAQRISDALVSTHPLLTMNEQFLDWGVWTERPMTYRLTALGQDLAYSPPSMPWACIGLCALIATPMLAIDAAGATSLRRRDRPIL